MKQGLSLACFLLSACFAVLSLLMLAGFLLQRTQPGLVLTLVGAAIAGWLFLSGAYLRSQATNSRNTE